MRNLSLFSAAAVLLLCLANVAVAQGSVPDLRELKQVAQLPPELPQRITGLGYDGVQLWATVYLGRGTYAKLDPATLKWSPDTKAEHNSVIAEMAGAFGSPGGVCFANGKLWIVGAYGGSFGSIDTGTWKKDQHFKLKLREGRGSQSYSSVVYDGNHLWIAWHWTKYDVPVSETQRLLKIDLPSGEVVAEYALPAGTRNDMTHGLTWDGTRLWHMKDQKLSAIDPSTGSVTAQYMIQDLQRPSGLAWVKDALWIAEFDGKIWRLPFVQ